MSIVRVQGLTEEQQEAQERAIQLVKSDLAGLVAAYRERYGVLVGTDLARELFPDYTADLESKLKFATAVQRSAAVVADEVFRVLVTESGGGAALFTAGGTGAGKTTSIMRDGTSKALLEAAAVIYDSNLNSENSAKAKIQMALDNGCKVAIIFVHRHPVEAYLDGVLKRAISQGRTVPIDGHLRIHRDARKTFLKLNRLFNSNSNVSFRVLNNTGNEFESFKTDVEYLKDVRYDDDSNIKAIIMEGLNHALAEEKISQALYEASRGITGTKGG